MEVLGKLSSIVLHFGANKNSFDALKLHVQRITITASSPTSRHIDPKVLASRTYRVL